MNHTAKVFYIRILLDLVILLTIPCFLMYIASGNKSDSITTGTIFDNTIKFRNVFFGIQTTIVFVMEIFIYFGSVVRAKQMIIKKNDKARRVGGPKQRKI